MRRVVIDGSLLGEVRGVGGGAGEKVKWSVVQLRLRPRSDGTFRAGVVARGDASASVVRDADARAAHSTQPVDIADAFCGRVRYAISGTVVNEIDSLGERIRQIPVSARSLQRCCWDAGAEGVVALAQGKVYLLRPGKPPKICPDAANVEDVLVGDFRGIGRDAVLAVASSGAAVLWDCECIWRGKLSASPSALPQLNPEPDVEPIPEIPGGHLLLETSLPQDIAGFKSEVNLRAKGRRLLLRCRPKEM